MPTPVQASPALASESPASWADRKRHATVLGRRMAYVEQGRGRPVVLLHGNPTSSFLWRNVLPYLEGLGRVIVPDLVGMGDSDKLPADEPDRYGFASQARHLDAFLLEVGADRDVVLVVHDWGGALGFDWAHRHQAAVRGLAYMETLVRPLSLADLPRSFDGTVGAIKSDDGERLVLEENMFIEALLPALTQRSLSREEMDEYRRPFLRQGDDRLPMLVWAREMPLDGSPAEVAGRMEAYGSWLRASSVPKLFIDAEPGVFITGAVRELCRTFPNQEEASTKGLHFVQEDDPATVGTALAAWLGKLG